ncbi:flt3-interacting zinc finger protein 1 isoform X1 [Tursiops truncatus]|uniref:Flt3-interacting zinc finger protein 1 n=2 Tax=Tursiops truncatus TaxID=9739 RepID=A0A6J3QJ36_TURTR|nr:flt3-interacting zinc finger protein 1 isoform X1 [Tursiops truncatus]
MSALIYVNTRQRRYRREEAARAELFALSLYGAGGHPKPRPFSMPSPKMAPPWLLEPPVAGKGTGKREKGGRRGGGKPRRREKGGVRGRREPRRKSRGPPGGSDATPAAQNVGAQREVESPHPPLPSHHATMDDAPLPAPPVPAPAPPAVAPRVPFHCSECGKSFRYRSDLRRHFARHTALKPHACPRCGKGFKHSFNLANHLRSHTGERPYRCSACPKGFRDSTGLLHHQVVHTGEKPYCCLVCELRFSSRSSLGRHLKRQHRGVLPSPLQPGPGLPALSAPCSVCCNVGPCSVCGGAGAGGGEGPEGAGAGPGSWGLAEAAAAAAASLPPFACGACARRFDQGRELAAHWAAHTDVKPFKCPRCERDFNAPALLERHKLTHDLQGPGAPPAQAWVSGAGAVPETAGEGGAAEASEAQPAWDGRLLLGRAGGGVPELGGLLPESGGEAPAPAAAAEPSEDTLYQCDCGTFFASAAALASHLEAHSRPATYGCGHCGALYAALAALEEHRRASHGEGGGAEEAAAPAPEREPASGEPASGSGRGKKIFGCSECEKLFRSPRDLERHVLVHTGEKPFPCLECGKFFRHECYLKRHRLLHGTERPFPCHICGKGFITLSNLSRHLKLHRGMD